MLSSPRPSTTRQSPDPPKHTDIQTEIDLDTYVDVMSDPTEDFFHKTLNVRKGRNEKVRKNVISVGK